MEETTRKGPRAFLIMLVAVGAAVLLYRMGRIPQPEGYHTFADTRTIWRIPNALNVLSNVPFFVVGWLGIAFLRRGPTRDPDGPYRPGAHTAFESMRERPAYVLFFLGVLLTAFGSGYYHLAPSTTRLFWDRLPMAIGFTALFAAMIAERVSIYWSRMVLLPLVFAGIASVVQWRLSEDAGRGDLRFYIFVQLFPIVALPLMMLLFKPRYSRGGELLLVAVVYVGAKALEHFDAKVWEVSGHVVGGHTLKHLVAAVATYLVLDMLKKRGRPLPSLTAALAASVDDDDDEPQKVGDID
ncbi:MAG: hypothetical protein KIT84_10060 [Labilithrix sp.]|nr:hypothetical protein [Labilithrix sp.]MCW5811347.1 hypothetical protein [Labilithrix sp.]